MAIPLLLVEVAVIASVEGASITKSAGIVKTIAVVVSDNMKKVESDTIAVRSEHVCPFGDNGEIVRITTFNDGDIKYHDDTFYIDGGRSALDPG